MPRIAGIMCHSPSCSPQRHALDVKNLATWQDRVGLKDRQILVMTSEGADPQCGSLLQAPDLGHRPVSDAEECRSIGYDGILYNGALLRAELALKGRHCQSTLDAEVILQAYVEWGEACFQRLHGTFAFALYDRSCRTIFLVRDQVGAKPLYYTSWGSHLGFSSELEMLTRLRPSLRINRQSLVEWSLYRNLASEETLFQDVYAVRPGHYIKVCAGQVDDMEYAYPTDYIHAATYERFLASSDALVEQEIARALEQSVWDCLDSEMLIGSACSGGVDSSLVTALASRSVPGLTTFHASASDAEGFDERRFAEVVAQTLRVPLVCCPVDQKIFQRSLTHVISLHGMPLAHIHLVAFFLITQRASAHGVRVLLTGDGADGQFGGLWHRHRRQPQLLWVKRMFARLPRRLRNALTLGGNLYEGMPFTMIGLERLLPHAVQSIDRYSRSEARLRLEQAYAFVPQERERSVLVTMIEDFMDNWDLERADRLGTAAGVECRSPFVHPVLLELSFNLPLRYRFRRMTDKWLLKRIAVRHLPRRIVHSQKRPWDFPWQQYLAPFARPAHFRGGFCTDALKLSSLAVEELVASWEANVQVFWNLMNLEIWGRLFCMHESEEQVSNLFQT